MSGLQPLSSLIRRNMTAVTAIALALSLFGCLAIYNATFHLAVPFFYVGRQLIWLLLGSMLMLAAVNYAARLTSRSILTLVLCAYLSLWAVLRFGIRINHMRGWFACQGVLMQPSELAKPVFVLGLSWLLKRTSTHGTCWYRGFLPLHLYLLLWLVPLALQPDFGALLIYSLTFAMLYWAMGRPIRHTAVAAAAALPATVFLLSLKPYLKVRLIGFLNPELHAETAGWHILQFQKTLANGGLLGQSWGKGLWSQAYLPLAYSDSMFAAVGEALGFLGLLPILLLMLAWVGYGYRRFIQIDDDFRAAAVLGIVLLLACQAFIHLSVNLGLMPTTGLTLPLFSYGGSSLLSTLAAVGIVEGLSRQATTS